MLISLAAVSNHERFREIKRGCGGGVGIEEDSSENEICKYASESSYRLSEDDATCDILTHSLFRTGHRLV